MCHQWFVLKFSFLPGVTSVQQTGPTSDRTYFRPDLLQTGPASDRTYRSDQVRALAGRRGAKRRQQVATRVSAWLETTNRIEA